MAHRGKETMVGVTTEEHVGFMSLFPDTRLVADAPDSPAARAVLELLQGWKEAGRPRIEDLRVRAAATVGGWRPVLESPAA